MSSTSTPENQSNQSLYIKVPQIIALFWVVKLLTTGMGEAFADYLQWNPDKSMVINSEIIALVALIAALALQFRSRRYVSWIYWLVVSMIGITGTMLADHMHDLQLSLITSSAIFATVLVIIFVVWYMSEKTLSIHSIYTKRREAFYWATVIVTFALGTALGDMTADTMDLGYLGSAVLFGLLFAIPFLANRFGVLNSVAAFWISYVMTRPFGASIADWLDAQPFRGGLGLGTLPVSIALMILILVFVAYLTITRIDVPSEPIREGSSFTIPIQPVKSDSV